MTRRSRGRAWAAGGAALAVLLVGAVAFDRSRRPPPAPPEVLERVGAKNEDAAIAAAARMKAESEAAARAADARLAREDERRESETSAGSRQP